MLMLISTASCLFGQIADTSNPGTFKDSRDGHKYKWVKIGTQTWMAENLAFLPAVSLSNTDSESRKHYYVYGYEGTNIDDAKASANYSTYGVLYNWLAAMDGASSSTSVPSGVQGACPAGWHLPSDEEWKMLEKHLGMSNSEADSIGWRSSGTVSGKLKETGTSHWKSPNTGATNSSRFTALSGGYRYYSGGFNELSLTASFWSASESDASCSWYRYLYYYHAGVHRYSYYKSYGFLVRCLKDE